MAAKCARILCRKRFAHLHFDERPIGRALDHAEARNRGTRFCTSHDIARVHAGVDPPLILRMVR